MRRLRLGGAEPDRPRPGTRSQHRGRISRQYAGFGAGDGFREGLPRFRRSPGGGRLLSPDSDAGVGRAGGDRPGQPAADVPAQGRAGRGKPPPPPPALPPTPAARSAAAPPSLDLGQGDGEPAERKARPRPTVPEYLREPRKRPAWLPAAAVVLVVCLHGGGADGVGSVRAGDSAGRHAGAMGNSRADSRQVAADRRRSDEGRGERREGRGERSRSTSRPQEPAKEPAKEPPARNRQRTAAEPVKSRRRAAKAGRPACRPPCRRRPRAETQPKLARKSRHRPKTSRRQPPPVDGRQAAAQDRSRRRRPSRPSADSEAAKTPPVESAPPSGEARQTPEPKPAEPAAARRPSRWGGSCRAIRCC